MPSRSPTFSRRRFLGTAAAAAPAVFGLASLRAQAPAPSPDGGFNAMSPALQRLPDGRIGMLFSYRQSQKIASCRFTSSADEGETWSPPVIVADGQYKTGCHDRFTVHSSGRLLAPCHCTEDWDLHHLGP